MTSSKRVAFIGNYLPRRCGIATFTYELHRAVATSRPDITTCVVAMNDHGRTYDYPAAVQFQIRDDIIADYVKAAEFLNDAHYDVVCLQHEFGIFGGEAGESIVALLSRLRMPVVTTLHTVLLTPTPQQRSVMNQVVELSARIVVMAEKAREILCSVYSVAADKVVVIPHGIPDFPFLETDRAKGEFGFGDKTVILTFGLLSPNKGIEVMIDAMPTILTSCPNAVYVVLGATHPNLVLEQGESYRESLATRARALGVDSRVVFFNQFVDQATLLEFISMCDVYVTPYLNESQMTSGTLAYSFGLGRAVVSTPYWHARELLADGRGILVPFSDPLRIGTEIAALLTHDTRRHAMRRRAYAYSRDMTWSQTASRYFAIFDGARILNPALRLAPIDPLAKTPIQIPVPEIQTDHFLSMCDGTGLLQHSVYSVADRSHGYCIDDNARALILACTLSDFGEVALPENLIARFAAFVQHAWNPDTGRFRNFMSYGRNWLEEQGSEDSHGRALWALGICARSDSDPARRRWARSLFERALPTVEKFNSPRTWAFTLLGLDAYCEDYTHAPGIDGVRTRLADKLTAALATVTTADWLWFEDELAYDNARICQALIVTGVATGKSSYVEAGLKSLRWLMTTQTAPAGCFRPVGTEGFGLSRQAPKCFDQQPLEAAATISACVAAWSATHDEPWAEDARRAFRWFLGDNDLGISLADPLTGACADGLHHDRRNENNGAESVLSYLLGLVEIRELARLSAASRTKERSAKLAFSA
jgi:glycosyltransferase involved in cell wall biosynthesis